ncbi:MAG: 50S ribosomal protein L5 [Candidatus Micrarchaeia archaeon]|jgi:large subunit ribosomal protein L5
MDANPNRDIVLEKVVINIGIGQNEQLYDNAKALLKKLTGHEAAPAKAKSRDPSLKIRKGQIIGVVVTLRKGDALSMLERAIDAVGTIKESSIRDNTLNFGIKEYIDFSGVKYDPKIGMFGMNINAVFARRGKRVEERKRKRSKASKEHMTVKKEEIKEYLKNKFGKDIVIG